MDERIYENKLKQRLRVLFPGCVLMKNDARRIQGIPDILILFNNCWAMLEVKMEDDSDRQPNQEHYIRTFNQMSFAAFINPSNEEEVLSDLQSAFGSARKACLSKS